MENSQLYYFFLAVFTILFGVSVFVAERVLVVLAGIAAIVTGVLALLLSF